MSIPEVSAISPAHQKEGVTSRVKESGILMLGAGGHAKMCTDLLRQIDAFDLSGIVTNDDAPDAFPAGIPVIGNDDDLEHLFDAGYRNAVIGIGAVRSPRLRQQLFDRLKAIGFHVPALIHPKAVVEPSAFLGEGVQVMAGAIVGSCARVSENCIVNSGSIVSHDCFLDSNAHITPGAILGGGVSVGKNSVIGMGSSIYMGVRVGNDSVVHNGLHIFRHIEDNEIVKK